MSKLTKKGVILPSYKRLSSLAAPVRLLSDEPLCLPLQLPDGTPCQPAAALPFSVHRGDALGAAEDGRVLPTPFDGVAETVCEWEHPLWGNIRCVTLRGTEAGFAPPERPFSCVTEGRATAEKRAAAIAETGIVDELDGVPLAEKIMAYRQAKRPFRLVADAAEQQPYGMAAWSVLDASAEKVCEGLRWLAEIGGAVDYQVALPSRLMRRWAAVPRERRRSVGRLYPWYDNLDLSLYSMHDRKHLPILRVGIQACLAAWYAAKYGEAPVGGVVTVAGDGVRHPQELWAPYGTRLSALLAACEATGDIAQVVLGDAVTGVSVADDAMPFLPGTDCVLAMRSSTTVSATACIGCGRCAAVCHAHLLPYEIMRYLDAMQYETVERLQPHRCDGCGACEYICPAKLPVSARVGEAQQCRGTIVLDGGADDEF